MDFTLSDFDLGQVVVVGEYTTPAGPADDHFLVVITQSGELREYCAGQCDPLVGRLEESLGMTVDFRLSNVTDWASRVIVPAQLKERPLFDWTRAPGLLGFARLRYIGTVTSEVHAFIGSKLSRPALD